MPAQVQHRYEGDLRWSGKVAADASAFRLERRFVLDFAGKPALEGAAPAIYNGTDAFHNPETLMLASLMACHHLTYLALCEKARIRLTAYVDHAVGTLAVRNGKMRMVDVLLAPSVTVTDPAHSERALALHQQAHANCFMANSVNFAIRVEATVSG